MRHRILLTTAVAVLLIGAGLVAVRLLGGPGSTLGEAVAMAPADAQRYTFTDWAAVRAEVGTSASEGDLAELLDAGFDADLTAASGLVDSAPLLSAEFGWSPATIDWELLAQSPEGAVEIVSLGEVSPDAVTDRLEALGYQRPAEDDGVWVGGTELLAGISGRTGLRATPTLQYVAVRDGLLWAGDRQPYLETALAGGDGPSDAVADLADSFTESPAAAVVYTADHACEALSMRQADDTDRATGDQLLARAGKINPVTAFAMGLLPGGGAEALLGFENDDQARTNADTRAVLAAGPAPGQGGDFSDRFAVDEVTSEGTLVRMVLEPEPGAFVLSDLSSGPVLFATC
ncbi:hypothetical protein [uncultured Nocardioides sp.]|uniref:hypothetical protein n=1 Tax=uncultured Nocardioides sp. TaxID=198441 RepID=UPI000C405C0B|nr:hypothetical protein [Nocardioides sp.]